MRKKTALVLALALTLSLALTGCGTRPLPEGMEEASVGETAEGLLALLLDRDYQGVADAFRGDMKERYQITGETVQAAMEAVEDAGGYVRTTDILAVGGKKSKSFDEPYGVAILYCKHEEKDVVYEFSLDTDLNLIGLAVKPKK